MTIVLFIVFGITMMMGMPVALSLLFGAIVAVLTMSDLPLFAVVRLVTPMFVDVSVLLCIPLYILAGNIMSMGGLGQRIIDFANIFVGRSRGGLGTVNILASLFFGGISGSATADTAALGSVLIPAMVKEGYPAPFATAVTVISSPLGMIIPPSIIMIVYSWITGESVAAMFAAGYIPGVMIGVTLILTSYVISVRNRYPLSRSYTLKEALTTAWKNFPAVIMPLFIVGTIVTGVATPTEAAAIAVIYGFLVARFFYRDLEWSAFPKILSDTAKLTGCVLILLAAASAFAWIITFDRTPFKVAEMLSNWGSTSMTFMAGYVVLLFIMGMFLAPTEALLIAVPILFPVAASLGIHPVHFGVVSCCCLATGQITPPVGFCLYLGSAIGGCPVETVVKALLPFYVTSLLVNLTIAFVPWFTLALPKVFGFIQ